MNADGFRKYSRREISMENIKRVAIYARYSTDMQRTESISAQVRAMEQYCHQRCWKIVAKYIDEALSATTDKRPQFQQMIEDSSKKAFDIVLVHKLDRFSRNRYDSTIYKSKLRQNNVMLCSVLEKIDDSPESVILESILEGISEYYSRNLSREVMKGMKENAYQARHCGGSAPLGYDVDSDGYLVINPHEAEAVRMIFQLYIDGYGLKQIANKLNSLGYKTKSGKPFVNSSFHSILTNIKYTGTFVFNQSVAKDCNHKRNSHKHKPESEIIKIENGCPIIISTDMFEQAQKQRIKNRNSKAMLKSNMFYLCSGIVKCGICGKTMFGSQRIVPGFFVYTCKSNLNICDNTKEISKDKLDKYTAELVGNELLNPDKMAVRIPLLNQRIDEHNQKTVLKRQSIMNKIEVITLRMLKLDDENKMDSKYLQLEEQRLNLKRELSLLHELPHINLDKYSEYILQYTTLNRSETKFRTLIHLFVKEIIVHKTRVTFFLMLASEYSITIPKNTMSAETDFLLPLSKKS